MPSTEGAGMPPIRGHGQHDGVDYPAPGGLFAFGGVEKDGAGIGNQPDAVCALRVEFTPGMITGKYFGAPRPNEAWSGAARLIDVFHLDVAHHKLVQQ